MVATMDACAVSGGAPPPEPGGYGLRVGMADCKWPGVLGDSQFPCAGPGAGTAAFAQWWRVLPPAGPLPLWHRGIWSEERGSGPSAVRFKAEFRAEYQMLSASRPTAGMAKSRPNLSGRERAGFGTRISGSGQSRGPRPHWHLSDWPGLA